MTGHVLTKAKEEGIEVGMNDILTKPVNIDTLKDQLLKHQIIIDWLLYFGKLWFWWNVCHRLTFYIPLYVIMSNLSTIIINTIIYS